MKICFCKALTKDYSVFCLLVLPNNGNSQLARSFDVLSFFRFHFLLYSASMMSHQLLKVDFSL